MQVRVADVEVPASPRIDHLYTIYQAPWIGGVFKTTNNGTTWEAIFDDQTNGSIGDVALSPSQPNNVWVGTGDAYASRSSYVGDGIYKSTDAGKTWKNMGLQDSHHIARIVVHPTDPNTVYVAVLGAPLLDQPGAGVYKTTNGGETWEKVLYFDEKIGIVDLVRESEEPRRRLRRRLRQDAAAVADGQRRPAERHPQDAPTPAAPGRSWRRVADRPHRAHRPRHLPEEPGDPLRHRREREPDRARRRRTGGRPSDRRRGVPHRERRAVVGQDEPRRRQRQQQGAVLLQPDPRRSQQRQDHLRDRLARRAVEGWRQDLGRGSSRGCSATSGRSGSTRRTPTG